MSHRIQRFATAVSSHKIFTMIAFLAILLTAWVRVQATRSDDEQEVKNTETARTIELEERSWPKDIIELVEIVNAQSQDFPKDLELKVKNISNKPIYYCRITIVFPESKAFIGEPAGIVTTYGEGRLISFQETPTKENSPIRPGEVMTLTEPQGKLWSWVEKLESNAKKQMVEIGFKHIKFVPQIINFGDGTGFVTNKPYPRRTMMISLPVDGNGKILPVPMNSPCPGGGGNCANGKLRSTDSYCYGDCQNTEIDIDPSYPCITRTQFWTGCCWDNMTSSGRS